jgi:dTDP-glucose 4,6-dehydratase
MDDSKLSALGWANEMRFEDGLSATVDWYLGNRDWWRSIKSGEWDAYYSRQYGDRLAGSRAAAAEAAKP